MNDSVRTREPAMFDVELESLDSLLVQENIIGKGNENREQSSIYPAGRQVLPQGISEDLSI